MLRDLTVMDRKNEAQGYPTPWILEISALTSPEPAVPLGHRAMSLLRMSHLTLELGVVRS